MYSTGAQICRSVGVNLRPQNQLSSKTFGYNFHNHRSSVCRCPSKNKTNNPKLLTSRYLSSLNVISKGIRCFSTSSVGNNQLNQQTKSRKPFPVIENTVDTEAEQFVKNLTVSKKLESKYYEIMGKIDGGGGPKAVERHTKAHKKLLAKDRLLSLLDDADDFLELSAFAGIGMDYGDIPRASVICGIGRVSGVYCMMGINDGTVKGGTMFPVTVKKQLRSQQVAIENRLPMLYVVDSGGAFLPLQADIFPDKNHGGRAFYNEAIMNQMGIPQLAVVCGSCTAGGAYVPTMVQEAVIVHRIGTIFLGGPPLVQAALGEVVSAEELGGATLHCTVSGDTDHFAGTEAEAFQMARDSVVTFNLQPPPPTLPYDEPIQSPEEILGLIPTRNLADMDLLQVISRTVDGSRFHQFKARYGTSLLTGFAYIKGHLVGIVANNGELTEDAATKGAHFVQLCGQRQVPLIFLQNITSGGNTSQSESDAEVVGRKIRSQARMMSAIACAQVPKITIITGNSSGVESYAMAGPSFSPTFSFCWPCAQISMTDMPTLVEEAIQTKMAGKDSVAAEELKEMKEKLLKKYAQQTSAIYAAGHVWNDGVILPQDTRKVIGLCLDIIAQSGARTETEYGILRM